jgi:hypothetical protein
MPHRTEVATGEAHERTHRRVLRIEVDVALESGNGNRSDISITSLSDTD